MIYVHKNMLQIVSDDARSSWGFDVTESFHEKVSCINCKYWYKTGDTDFRTGKSTGKCTFDGMASGSYTREDEFCSDFKNQE